jgi:competence protein ComEC
MRTGRRFLIAAALLLAWAQTLSTQEPALLRVHFVDVGQGDGVLIQSPTGQNVVYDAGEHSERMRDYLAANGISSVGLAIASHNHTDHIGGLPLVIRVLRPSYYLENGVAASTQTYARVLDAAAATGSQLLEPTVRRVRLGDVALTVVPPPGIADWDQNDNSIALVAEYGSFRLSMAGDAESREWAWWRIHQPEWLKPVQVHKASHHGSINGDTAEAVAALSPKTVIVSAGAGNSYGHPDQAALDLYANIGARVYRTDIHGTLIVEAQSSGAYAVRVERAEGAQPNPPPQPACIDINRADVVQLQEIIHIGPARAQEIIDLRKVQPFRSVSELERVSGIGPARLADIIAERKACVL